MMHGGIELRICRRFRNIKHMIGKRLFLMVCCITFFVGSEQAQRLVKAGEGYSSTSVNTAVFRNNSVTSKGDMQFIAYYDPEGYLTLGKRLLKGDGGFETLRSKYRGKVTDAHNIISIGIDGKGYLHVAFNHHNANLQYCRSVEPYSLELGELEPMVGRDETRLTYPEFYSLKNGDLLFAYRYGKSGRGNLVMNRYDVKSGVWRRVQDNLIDGEGERNAYWQMCVDRNDVIHVSWVWRETPAVETNHDLCYARSKDGGLTWERSTGEKYPLPINAGNAEYAFRIPQGSELINQTSMAADKKGNPFIAAYWKGEDEECPQYKLVFKDKDGWKCKRVHHRSTDFTLRGNGTKMIPIARPRIAVDSKNNVYYIYRDIERGSRVSLAFSGDYARDKWDVRDLTDFSVDAWEPSYDNNLWNAEGKLHIYVQCASQGDGEKVKESAPSPVYVLEVK